MKQKLFPKYLIAAVIALSLFSFAYVNLHAVYSSQASCEQKANTPQPVLVEEEDETRSIPVPDITIIGRVLDIVQRYTSTNQ
jgi:hypothetical protein